VTSSTRTSCETEGKGRNARERLPSRECSTDHYLREYTERRKPVAAPRDDLAGQFFWSPNLSALQVAP